MGRAEGPDPVGLNYSEPCLSDTAPGSPNRRPTHVQTPNAGYGARSLGTRKTAVIRARITGD